MSAASMLKEQCSQSDSFRKKKDSDLSQFCLKTEALWFFNTLSCFSEKAQGKLAETFLSRIKDDIRDLQTKKSAYIQIVRGQCKNALAYKVDDRFSGVRIPSRALARYIMIYDPLQYDDGSRLLTVW